MISIVFAINDGYVKQLATTIVSILKHTDAECEFNILSSDITDDNKKIIASLSKYNAKSTFNFIDMKNVLENIELENYMSRRDDYTHISIETYFRFFIPELFPNHSKMLYLDADILVLDDISKLYDTDISNNSAGVIEDTVLKVFVKDEKIKTSTLPKRDYATYFSEKLKKKNTRYFNAGVLLMNLDYFRKHNLVEKLWQFTADESPLEYQDQDALNAVLEDSVQYVDHKWNTLKDSWFIHQLKDKKERKTLLKTYKKPGIFHYVGANKPWLLHDESYDYAFIKEWWNYCKLTPYYEEKDKATEKAILSNHRAGKWLDLITIKIGNLDIFTVYQIPYMIRIRILGIKTHIRLKKYIQE